MHTHVMQSSVQDIHIMSNKHALYSAHIYSAHIFGQLSKARDDADEALLVDDLADLDDVGVDEVPLNADLPLDVLRQHLDLVNQPELRFGPPEPCDPRALQPISVLRFWISEGLTQA